MYCQSWNAMFHQRHVCHGTVSKVFILCNYLRKAVSHNGSKSCGKWKINWISLTSMNVSSPTKLSLCGGVLLGECLCWYRSFGRWSCGCARIRSLWWLLLAWWKKPLQLQLQFKDLLGQICLLFCMTLKIIWFWGENRREEALAKQLRRAASVTCWKFMVRSHLGLKDNYCFEKQSYSV